MSDRAYCEDCRIVVPLCEGCGYCPKDCRCEPEEIEEEDDVSTEPHALPTGRIV